MGYYKTLSYLKREKQGHRRDQLKAKPNLNGIDCSIYLEYLEFTHNLGFSQGPGSCLRLHPLQHTHTHTHSWPSRLRLTQLHCCCCSWYLSHGTGISKVPSSSCNWAALSPTASPGLSSRCQTSPSPHDPFDPGPSTATEAAPLSVAFFGLSQGQASAALHDPSCLQNQCHLGDSYPTTLLEDKCQDEKKPWPLLRARLLCVDPEETLPRKTSPQ